MKKLFLIVILFLPCHAWAASCSNTNIGNGWTCVISGSNALGVNGGSTTGINTTGSNLLVIVDSEYAGQGSPTTPCTPSDTIGGSASGNTWTLLNRATDVGTISTISIWYVNATPAVGANHVVTCTNTGITNAVAFAGFKPAIKPVDQQSTGTAAASTTIQPGSVTPSVNTELLITGFSGGTVGTESINSSFVIAENIAAVGGNNMAMAFAYLTQSTAAAVNPTWTSTASQGGSTASIATFKLSSAGTGGGKGQLNLVGSGK